MEDAATIRAKTACDAAMYDALLARVTALAPQGGEASFDFLTTKDLRGKAVALERALAMDAVRAHMPAIAAAQKSPLAEVIAPTVPVLDALAGIAAIAGATLSRYFNTRAFTYHYQTGQDIDPGANARSDAQDVITAGLRVLAPHIPVVSTVPQARRAWGQATQIWLVDPLCDSAGLTGATGTFSINIALLHRGRPLLGVVHAPALQRSWLGLPHQSLALLRTPHRERRLHVRQREAGKRRAIVPSAMPVSARAELRKAAGIARTISADALALCRMAEGQADLALTSAAAFWSVAAPVAIARAAGAAILQVDDGAPADFSHLGRHAQQPALRAV